MAKTRTATPTNPAEQHNIIGASTTVEGTVRSKGNVNVSGTVNGNVEVDGRTIVMPGGVVEGEVSTTTAEIAGTVRGRITVRERLVLKASAVIEGDIVTDKLVVEDGATFNGECRMGQAAKDTSSRDRSPKRNASESDASFTVVSGDA
ncbi:bactofilin family protein [Rubrivirga sp.]|uniref:bactofilin family protein n=1 Tax=Rubrivirga sp. TaxID=1885344 RepID=UPI003C706540